MHVKKRKIKKCYKKEKKWTPEQRLPWGNKRLVLGLLSLLCVILLLPSFIVLVSNKESLTEVPTREMTVKETTLLETPLVVSVERSETNQIDEIPLETYVAAVVASEMPAQFELEALKAQAVAARTYVVNHLLQTDATTPITDTVMHQVYRDEAELKKTLGKDYEWVMKKVHRAVAETKSEIITYENEPITPTFFSMSNGFTENAENYWGKAFPYLKSVESRWEEAHPKFNVQEIYSVEEVGEKLGISLQEEQNLEMKITRNDTERVREFSIAGHTFTGKEVREKLQLRSHDFTVQQKGNYFIFQTKGYGHGVGMSQYGANGMAKEGKRYDEILQYYYQGVELSTIFEATPALVVKE